MREEGEARLKRQTSGKRVSVQSNGNAPRFRFLNHRKAENNDELLDLCLLGTANRKETGR
jgi:hypothetical protein